jgi:transcriptional regulator with GAF, ATPase, and Fis domain
MPDALQAIGEFLGVDCVVLWRLATDAKRLSPLHHWFATGFPTPSADLWTVDLPWMSERVLRGEVVRLASLADLPAEASADERILDELGIQSLLLVPLQVDGSAAGALSLEMRVAEQSRVDALIPRVRLIGESLMNVLEHHRKSRLLEAAQPKLPSFANAFPHLVRVHTVGEMSAALAHEINQPLGGRELRPCRPPACAGDDPDLAKVVDLLDSHQPGGARW